MLLTAFAMARQQGLPENIKLVCTGDCSDRSNILKHITNGLGLKDCVLITGFIKQIELEDLYDKTLAVIFPSLYEGFGMPVIEAMARGIPVACSNTTALGEVAGDAALLFNPGNPQQIATALIRMIREPTLRKSLITQGLRQAEKYTHVSVMVEQYWDLLHEAHSSGHRSNRITPDQ